MEVGIGSSSYHSLRRPHVLEMATAAPPTATLYPPSTFETLLFSLPAELRVEIYNLALSLPRDNLNLLDDHRSIQWLTVSPHRRRRRSTAPLQPRPPPLRPRLRHYTRARSLGALLYSHAETTFLPDRKWAYAAIGEMAKELVIDVPRPRGERDTSVAPRSPVDRATCCNAASRPCRP